MKHFKTIVGYLWLSHHGRVLFVLPNPTKTTIARPSHLLYDDAIDGELGGVENGGVQVGGHDNDNDDDDETEEAPRVNGNRRQAPAGPSGAPISTVDATSSGPWVHPYFRQFSTASTSYKFKTRRSYAISRTCPPGLLCL